ncbi:MAG: HNH endonuclease, partial [Phycisphaerae bacterium]|nr:HNH endonuclease [Phycisphaerae bacterium]
MGKQRRGPSQKTIKALFAVSGNRCAFPDCDRPLIHTDNQTVLGEVCHIRAEREGWARYDPTQTEKQRNGYDNLILLSREHHRIIDADESTYTVEILCDWKQKHQENYKSQPGPKLTAKMIEEIIERLTAPKLALVAPESRRPRDTTEASLLNPYLRATMFVGRDKDLGELVTWANSQRPIAVRTIVGRGGAGKTRLAIELIDALGPEWDAGFLTPEEMSRLQEKVSLTQWEWHYRTLAVVDYAGAVAGEVGKWLGELSTNPTMDSLERGDRPPLRILLLERQASEDAGWLRLLLPESQSKARIHEMFDPPEPVEIGPIQTGADRRGLLGNMLVLCAERRRTPPPKLPDPGMDEEFERQLAEPQWGDPLMLMMAAMVGIESGVPQALSLSRTDLGERIAKREIEQIENNAAHASDPQTAKRLMPLLAAAATLGRGLTREQAVVLSMVMGRILDWTYPGGAGRVVDEVASVLPDGKGGIAPVLPDMVGEAFAYLVLTTGEQALPDAQRRQILRATLEVGAGAFRTITLLAQDYAGRHPDILDWLDPLIHEGKKGNLGLLMQLSDAIPRDTLALRDKALVVCEAIMDTFRKAAEKDSSEKTLCGLAVALHNYGTRLSKVGRRKE